MTPASTPRAVEPSDFDPEALLRIVRACEAADGVAPLNEATLLRLASTGLDGMTLVMDQDGAGFALVADDGSLSVAVDPGHRSAGRATSLARAALDLAGDRVRTVWAHGDLPGARRLAARFGFTARRELWRMERPAAGDLQPAPAPPSTLIRPFEVGADEDAFLAVNAAAFADHPEQGRLDRSGLALRTQQDWFDPDGFFVAEQDGELVGFHWTKLTPDNRQLGEVYAIGVVPEARGTGLARALLRTGLAHLADRGVERVQLYVEADNAPAIVVYRAFGFHHVGTDVQFSQIQI